MNYAEKHLSQAKTIIEKIDSNSIEQMVEVLLACRKAGGRLFLIGSGGGAGNASHATCDFRKLCGFEAYCPMDNVSELTARINDDGWDSSISNYLRGSKIKKGDCLFVLSVGGGDEKNNISKNLVNAIKVAKECGAFVVGVVGRDGGFTSQNADACLVVPTVDSATITPHTEAFQAVAWHLLVSHPRLKMSETKWESTSTYVSPATQYATNGKTIGTSIITTKIFADGADKAGMVEMYNNPLISGFTTNPTLMRKAGIKDYREFAHDILTIIHDRPISFEVFSDDFNEMKRQALEIASWGENVYVKVPITNTKGESAASLIADLCKAGIKLNVTAIMTTDQVREVLPALSTSKAAYISVFAGRIADTGRDPMPIMKEIMAMLKPYRQLELIWASPRELYNVMQANEIGCHIITATNDILKKLALVGKDLNLYSLETVKMFYDDAKASGFTLEEKSSLIVEQQEISAIK